MILHICVNQYSCPMKLYTLEANQMRDIEDFVNNNGLDRKDIVEIFQAKDGDYVLVYYAE